ncbi:MAG: hypothetical protein MUF10_14705 [Thermoanaerobaculaceae bacterium]|jgi:uncharacterized protein YxjI|nr:hypothetical protein [Thermoanaerobaculaceae bacterium]
MGDRFAYSTYLIRRKVFKLAGGAFHIFDPQGQLLMYSHMKAFKLKEDIRLFTGEDMREELLAIHARTVLDISATYDVTDSTTGQAVGALRRKGMRSLLRDEWLLLDTTDREVGLIREDSLGKALLRRFLTNLVPQSFEAEMAGHKVATFRQNFNPFVLKLTVDFTPDQTRALDRRLGLAAAILLCAIEGRQG